MSVCYSFVYDLHECSQHLLKSKQEVWTACQFAVNLALTQALSFDIGIWEVY